MFNAKPGSIFGLSGISTGLSGLCYFQALSVGPASRVAPFDELSVALVIASGALLLGEGLTWGQGRALPVRGAQAIAIALG